MILGKSTFQVIPSADINPPLPDDAVGGRFTFLKGIFFAVGGCLHVGL